MAHVLSHRGYHKHMEQEDDRDHLVSKQTVVDKDLMRSRFGGFHLGSAFFGWLVATGLATMLIAILAAAGSAVALTAVEAVTGETAATVGIVSGVMLILALGIAYYAGGYVAGRMARFDGARQGAGVWAMGLLLTIVLGILGATAGSQFNVLQQLNLPRLPINEGTLTTGGLLTLLGVTLVTLLTAMTGGKKGERYHDRIDAAGTVDTRER